ncbi:MAG: insulinase family protein [Alphaproteobacteria bacterium]|nr:insulinase family protein [Alphaproteobacteria bacterium]QQS58272.1 MAG: insulinase family protein [Alphaproteobacteria bacterium]
MTPFRFRAFFLVLLFGFFIVPAAADAREPQVASQTAPEKVFNAKTFTLANGLQGVVVENHSAPVITHMVWYRVGAADEVAGKSGIAHFLEHLMFKGQSYPGLLTLKPGEFSKMVRSLGGQDNAFTAQDYTAYFQTIASKHLETVMKMEAGRMRGLNLPKAEVDAERLVILEERRQRVDNDPRAQFDEQFSEVLFANHPYRKPVIGWFHEMEGLTWEDATSFYKKWYAPNNAFLIVSGDVTVEQVKALAEKTYGLIPRTEVPERKRTVSPPFIGRTSVTMAHEVIKEPVFLREYRVPSARQNLKDSLALQVLEEIMDGGPTSRLYKSLVVEKKIASSVGLSYNSYSWDDSTLSLSAVPMEGLSLKQAEEALDTELRALIKDGVTPQELKDAVLRLQAEAIYARDSVAGPAMVIGYTLVTGVSLEDLETWPQQIESVTAQQVQDVAARFLNPDKPTPTPYVNGTLTPLQNAAPSPETAPQKP